MCHRFALTYILSRHVAVSPHPVTRAPLSFNSHHLGRQVVICFMAAQCTSPCTTIITRMQNRAASHAQFEPVHAHLGLVE